MRTQRLQMSWKDLRSKHDRICNPYNDNTAKKRAKFISRSYKQANKKLHTCLDTKNAIFLIAIIVCIIATYRNLISTVSRAQSGLKFRNSNSGLLKQNMAGELPKLVLKKDDLTEAHVYLHGKSSRYCILEDNYQQYVLRCFA